MYHLTRILGALVVLNKLIDEGYQSHDVGVRIGTGEGVLGLEILRHSFGENSKVDAIRLLEITFVKFI